MLEIYFKLMKTKLKHSLFQIKTNWLREDEAVELRSQLLSVLVKMSVSDVGKQLVAERMNKHPEWASLATAEPRSDPGDCGQS